MVASTEIFGDCVHPMKNRERRAVEGRPVMIPPIFVPYLSAKYVADVTQIPPIMKDKISFKTKMLFNGRSGIRFPAHVDVSEDVWFSESLHFRYQLPNFVYGFLNSCLFVHG